MADSKDKDQKAAELGRRGGKKGGKARAAALGPSGLSESGRKAAEARWLKATHVGTLPIIGKKVACANLENGVRVLSYREFYTAIGGTKQTTSERYDRAGDVPAFLAAKNLQAFISDELRATVNNQISYRFEHVAPDGTKTMHRAIGVDARLIPEICEVFLGARDAGALHHTQHDIAKAAEIMMRALARVGIIALVDEATGFQADRQRDELAKIVDAYVSEEWRKWTRVFPHEFFKQIHRIQGWSYTDRQTSHPQYVGKLINEYIYARLPEGVLERLRAVNPSVEGRRRRKHTQHITDETGVPHLDKQITAVTTLLAVSDDKPMFEALLKKRFPKQGEQMSLLLPNRKDREDD
jgi:hypothetical protein